MRKERKKRYDRIFLDEKRPEETRKEERECELIFSEEKKFFFFSFFFFPFIFHIAKWFKIQASSFGDEKFGTTGT